MPPTRTLAATICALLAASTLHAEDTAAPDAGDGAKNAVPLQEVTVTASPLAQPGAELIQPSAILSGAQLDDRRGNTIGETVNQIPGVQASFFGAGVGRPIIRGLEGSRVQVLEGGVGTLDLSGASNDHAVTVDPFLADQVEVLKGPSTLLYGAGAIGGVVNVVDGRIPEKALDGVHGRVQLGADTVSDERNAVGRVDAGAGPFVLHADWSRRFADDYDLPRGGSLLNSDTSTRSDAFGASYIGARGFVGVAVSELENHYGIPVGPSKAPVDPDLERVRIDMQQTRVDLKAGLDAPFDGLERVTLRYAHNDYEHVEHAVDEAQGTRFLNRGYEARVEAVHVPLGAWRGAFGVQFRDRDFSALGEETIVPDTAIKDAGVFVAEQADFAPFKLQLGARYDRRKLDADGFDPVSVNAASFSGGLVWEFVDHWHLALNLDRAQRAPDEEELFVHGAHDATGSFELGDPRLRRETANQVDLGLHYHTDTVQASIGIYANRYRDFIYLAETGQMQDDLPVRQWAQHDATFHGIEGELKIMLAEGGWGRLDLRSFGDTVDAKLTDGAGRLPRIAPARFGSTLTWTRDAWRASLGAVRYAKQDELAAFETPTPGYTWVTAHLSYDLDAGATNWEFFADANNLTNQEARAATSFLKDRAPLPGRGVAFGVRAYF